MKLMTIEEILIRVKNAMIIGEYGLAEDLLKKIISTKPDFFLPYMLLGNVCGKTGRGEQALKLFKQSIRLKPDNVEAYNIAVTAYNLGSGSYSYSELKQWTENLEILEKSLSQIGLSEENVRSMQVYW